MKLLKLTLCMLLVLHLATLTLLMGSTPPPPKKIYVTKHVNPHPPSIDGKLDDPAWKGVDWEGEFIQLEPYEGKSPSQPTAFKIMYDDQHLYVGIRAYDSEPDKIVKRMARRDNFEGDWVQVQIDSYHDLRTAFAFAVNAGGVKCDTTFTEDGDNQDRSWDPIWFVKTATDDKGWTAEMKIPFSQLRYASQDDLVWGLQCSRRLFRKEEQSGWQYIPKDSPGQVHRFGELRGIKKIDYKRRVALTPYAVAKADRFEKEEGNPFATGRGQNVRFGLDGKIGITSDLTMDFTINPDFGQVEADPSEVNLSTTESYFAEKRPFFIEGRNILNFQIMGGNGGFSSDNLFYSRRIGRSPHYSPDTGDDEYLNMPANTAILGAFKLTGKTRNGLSIGILDSVTGSESAQIDHLGARRFEAVEPATNYFLLRLQKEYNKGKTIIGGMFTATNRFLKDSDPQLNYLHRAAYTGGINFAHSWKNKTYVLSVKTVFSHVTGDKEAILNTQESPIRYYQRPDASHLSIDPNRTSLTGHGGTVSFGKMGSGSLKFGTGVTWRSPGLELNDIGYLRSTDRIMQWVWVGYRIYKPFSIFKTISISLNQWQGWDFSGERLFKGGNVGVYAQFKNHWGINFGLNPQGKSISTAALRGGPSLRRLAGLNQWLSIHTDSRKKIRLSFNTGNYWGKENSSRSKSYSVGLTYRPSSKLSLSVSPSYRSGRQQLQYVTTEDVGESSRYVFATLHQKTVSVTMRLNYSITPELSIQFYGQPFISAGDYVEFKQITDPGAEAYTGRFAAYGPSEIAYNSADEEYSIDENMDGMSDYSFGNPDFNFLQLRSNLVVRWEYRPGSTVYLVWSQGRTGSDSLGNFSMGRDFRELFSIKPYNVFLVKFTHRFNL